MAEQPSTLAEFFAPSMGKSIWDRLHDDERAELDATIRATPGLKWDRLTEDFNGAFRSILEVKLADILLGGWAKLRELQEYLDSDKHPPTESSRVPLKKHSIKSTHSPSIEILVADQLITKLDFDVVAELKIETFVLRIQSGRIWEISSGDYQGVGTIKCRGFTLIKKSSGKYRFPGDVPLETGFPIPRLPAGI